MEHGGAGREREAGEQRAAGAADAERHREREPERGPTSGGAVALVNGNENMPSITPPMPAIAADRAKIRIFERFTAMPDASAATSELRTARVARPDDERISAWIDEREQTEHREEQQDLLLEQAEVDLGQVRDVAGPFELVHDEVVEPVEAGDVERRRADRPPALAVADRRRSANGTSARKNAHARVPSAKFTPPRRISGNASNAPSAAAASAAITTAQKKLIWPWANDARDVRRRSRG